MKQLLTVKDLAKFLQTSDASIRNAIYKKRWDRIPPPMRMGSRRYWTEKQVEQWLQQKIQLAYKFAYDGAHTKKGRPTKTEAIIKQNTPML